MRAATDRIERERGQGDGAAVGAMHQQIVAASTAAKAAADAFTTEWPERMVWWLRDHPAFDLAAIKGDIAALDLAVHRLRRAVTAVEDGRLDRVIRRIDSGALICGECGNSDGIKDVIEDGDRYWHCPKCATTCLAQESEDDD